MKTKELVSKLEEGVKGVFEDENFKEWLKMQAKFHSYSSANTILILKQKPNASKVAGFNTWKKLGRYVRKGEQGIFIFAPIIKKHKKVNEITGEETEKKYLTGFKPVHVFDVSQTEGKELPEIAKELESESEIAKNLYDDLLDIAEEMNLEVTRYDASKKRANGYFNPKDYEIGIKEAAIDQMVKTFIHELAHALTKDYLYSYEQGEIIAEGTAFIVASHFGLDTSDYSFEYVAAWASRQIRPTKNEKNKLDPLKQTTDTIQKTASKLIDKLSKKEPEKTKALVN